MTSTVVAIGSSASVGTVLLEPLVQTYLQDLHVLGRSANTIASYRGDLRRLVDFVGGGVSVRLVTGDTLRRFMATQADVSVATRARRQAAVTSFLTWCVVRQGSIEANPAARLERVQREDRGPRPLAQQDIERVLGAIPGAKLRDRLLFTLLCETGMRIGEALGIYVEDLDLTRDNEFVRVRRPKGPRERIVLLADAPRSRMLLRRFLKASAYKTGPLFRGDERRRARANGEGPLTYRAALSAWGRYCRAAGVTGTIHQLRHAVGTALVNDGLPLEAVRRRLGHATLAMVNRYGEMSDAVLAGHLRDRERRRARYEA